MKPSTVEGILDVPTEKTLPIQVDWVGKLSPDLILSLVELDPPAITVVGGKSILHEIRTTYTEKIPLEGIKGPGTVTAKLVLDPASLKLASGKKEKVRITIDVKKREKLPEGP